MDCILCLESYYADPADPAADPAAAPAAAPAINTFIRVCDNTSQYHFCCQPCLQDYLKFYIRQKRHKIPCIGLGCPCNISENVIDLFANDFVKEQFSTIRNLTNVKNGVFCPNCSNAESCINPETNPEMRCTNCGTFFCFHHHLLHENMSCSDYIHRIQGHNKLTITERLHNSLWLLLNTKKCPNRHCQVSIQKNGGCRSMWCVKCHTNFCWQCLKILKSHHHHCSCDIRIIISQVALFGFLFFSFLKFFINYFDLTTYFFAFVANISLVIYLSTASFVKNFINTIYSFFIQEIDDDNDEF